MKKSKAKNAIFFLVAVLIFSFIGANQLFSIDQFPNMYNGNITYCSSPAEGDPGRYCTVRKAVANYVNGNSQVISEGTIVADKPITSAMLKSYVSINANPENCAKSASAKIEVYNFVSKQYVQMFSDSASNSVKEFLWDIGDTMPGGISVTTDPQTYVGDYRGYSWFRSTYSGFNASKDFVDADEKTMKIRLTLQGSGYCGQVGYAEVLGINGVFNYKPEAGGGSSPNTNPATGGTTPDNEEDNTANSIPFVGPIITKLSSGMVVLYTTIGLFVVAIIGVIGYGLLKKKRIL